MLWMMFSVWANVSVLFSLATEARAESRWCSLLGVATRESISTRIVPPAPFNVDCDGKWGKRVSRYGFSYLKGETPIEAVGIAIYPPGSWMPDRAVVWTPPPGFALAQLAAITDAFKYANLPIQDRGFKEQLVGLATQQGVRAQADWFMTIVSMRISSEVPIYADSEATEWASDLTPPPFLAISGVHQQFLNLLSVWSSVPGAFWVTALNEKDKQIEMKGDASYFSGDQHHIPLLVMQAVVKAQKLQDYVITPEGVYTYQHDGKPLYHLEIPGSEAFPQPVYVTGSYRRQNDGVSVHIRVETTYSENLRAKLIRLDKNLLDRNPAHEALGVARALIIQTSRSFRALFDSNPRFRSDWNMHSVKQALALAKQDRVLFPHEGVPEEQRQYTHADELFYFEEYLRKHVHHN